jgi:hypothetical protein
VDTVVLTSLIPFRKCAVSSLDFRVPGSLVGSNNMARPDFHRSDLISTKETFHRPGFIYCTHSSLLHAKRAGEEAGWFVFTRNKNVPIIRRKLWWDL